MAQYKSNIEGKEAFVREQLKPLFLAMDDCWEDVQYKYKVFEGEYVVVKHKNPDKTVEINVTADSISALVSDVFRGVALY